MDKPRLTERVDQSELFIEYFFHYKAAALYDHA